MLPLLSPIVCNNTMDKKFLLRVGQSNKCGRVTTNKVLNWPLGSGAGPLISIAYLLRDTSYIHRFNLPKQSPRNKPRIQKKINSQQRVSNCLSLHTQKPELKKLHFTLSAKEAVTRPTCWKKEEIPEKKTNHRPCTNIWLLAGQNKGRLATRF